MNEMLQLDEHGIISTVKVADDDGLEMHGIDEDMATRIAA